MKILISIRGKDIGVSHLDNLFIHDSLLRPRKEIELLIKNELLKLPQIGDFVQHGGYKFIKLNESDSESERQSSPPTGHRRISGKKKTKGKTEPEPTFKNKTLRNH